MLAVLNAAMAAKQYQNFGSVSVAMMLVNLFQLTYVVDALWNEVSVINNLPISLLVGLSSSLSSSL